jgi:hypothetical protein
MKMKFCIEANGEGLVSVCIEGKAIELSALLATVMDQDGMIRELITKAHMAVLFGKRLNGEAVKKDEDDKEMIAALYGSICTD